jgi:hypothetical protein
MTSTDSTKLVSSTKEEMEEMLPLRCCSTAPLGLNFLLREKTDSIKTYSNGLDVLGHLGGTGPYHL